MTQTTTDRAQTAGGGSDPSSRAVADRGWRVGRRHGAWGVGMVSGVRA
jgi:hypothetical protein